MATILGAETAQVIRDLGKTFSIKRETPGSYNVATATIAKTDDSYGPSARGAFLSYGLREIDGTLIQSGDVKLVIDSASVSKEPLPEDVVTEGARKFRVQNVQRIETQGNPVVYVCQCRKF